MDYAALALSLTKGAMHVQAEALARGPSPAIAVCDKGGAPSEHAEQGDRDRREENARLIASAFGRPTMLLPRWVRLGDHMSEQEKGIVLEGIVHASRYDRSGQGKQFLGAAIECSDGTVWVIDYSEQSPFHVFAGRQVVV